MTLNLTPNQHRVWVCKETEDETTGLEVSTALMGDGGGWFSATDYPLDVAGRFRTTGELVLREPDGWSGESFDPRDNESRWSIGNTVLIQVKGDDGTWRSHPRSGLKILSDPLPPSRKSPNLTLELGDALELHNVTGDRDDDYSGVNLGSSTDRDVIVQRLLDTKGLTLSGTIPLFPVNYPVPKSGVTVVDLCSKLAISGLRGLWVDQEGRVRARSLPLKPAIRLFKQTVGTDDADDWEPRSSAQRPASLIRATSVGQDVSLAATEGESEFDEYAPKESVVKGGGAAIIKVGERRESWQWQNNRFTRVLEVRRARALVLADDFFEAVVATKPDPYTLIQQLYQEETKTYERSEEGRLTTESVLIREPRGVTYNDLYRNFKKSYETIVSGTGGTTTSQTTFTPSGINFLGMVDSRIETTRYSYRQDEVEAIAFEATEPRGKIAGQADDWDDFTGIDLPELSEKRDTGWQDFSTDEWERTEVSQKAGTVSSGGIQAFLALSLSVNPVRANDGSTQPQSADRRPPTWKREEVPLEAEAEFMTRTGDRFSPREDVIQFEYATKPALGYLARYFGTLQRADHRGFRIVSGWRDEFFGYQPGSRVDCEHDGVIDIGIARTVAWAIADDESTVVFDCGTLGRVRGADSYPGDLPAQEWETDYPDSYDDPTQDSDQDWEPIHLSKPVLGAVLGFAAKLRGGPVYTVPSPAFVGAGLGFAASQRYLLKAGLGFGASLVPTILPYEGTLVGAIAPLSPTGYDVRVYYATPGLPTANSDIAAYYLASYVWGVDYTALIPLTLTPLIQANGPGYYLLAAVRQDAPTQFWASGVNLTLTAAVLFSADYYYDSGVGETSALTYAKVEIEIRDANTTTLTATPTGLLQTGNNLRIYYSESRPTPGGDLTTAFVDELVYGTDFDDITDIDLTPYLTLGDGFYYLGFAGVDLTYDFDVAYTHPATLLANELYYDGDLDPINTLGAVARIEISNGDVDVQFEFNFVET